MKKFFTGILNIFLSIFIFLLLFSFYGKTIFSGFITDFLGGLSTNIVDNSFVEENNTDDSSIKIERNITIDELLTSPEYKELLKNKEIQKLIDKYVDSTIIGVTDPDSLTNINLTEDIINFIIENKDVLEKEYNISISDEDINSMRENKDFNNLTNNFIENIKTVSESLTTTQKRLIKAYNFVCGITFKVILIFLIIIDIVLISILQKSAIKWIKVIGANLLSSGILTIILGLILHFSVNSIIEKMKYNLKFDFLKISLIGLIATIIGVILMIVYHFINKNKNNDNNNELYDEVSKGEEKEEVEDFYEDDNKMNKFFDNIPIENEEEQKESDSNNELYDVLSKSGYEQYKENHNSLNELYDETSEENKEYHENDDDINKLYDEVSKGEDEDFHEDDEENDFFS